MIDGLNMIETPLQARRVKIQQKSLQSTEL